MIVARTKPLETVQKNGPSPGGYGLIPESESYSPVSYLLIPIRWTAAPGLYDTRPVDNRLRIACKLKQLMTSRSTSARAKRGLLPGVCYDAKIRSIIQ